MFYQTLRVTAKAVSSQFFKWPPQQSAHLKMCQSSNYTNLGYEPSAKYYSSQSMVANMDCLIDTPQSSSFIWCPVGGTNEEHLAPFGDISLRERFIQRLILNGKKSIATKIFDESLELLKTRIEQHNKSDSKNSEGNRALNLHSLASLTKDEIFIIALRKAQP